MSSSKPTKEETRLIEAHAILALQTLLDGRMPDESHVKPLTGELKEHVKALTLALQVGGHAGVKKAWHVLLVDSGYLGQLVSRQPPVFNPDGTLAATESEKPKPRIHFTLAEDMLKRPGQPWLIPQILPRDSVALVYGESGSLKSFLAMAWSLAIGTGRPWLGRKVAQGPVAYVAAEGGYGVMKRLNAWITHHGWSIPNPHRLGVAFYDAPLALQEPDMVKELLTVIQAEFTDYFEQAPVMIVLDTLSRCAAGADEDSNTEMAKVLGAADIIRERLHCTVLIVHHTGKDSQRGPRGASALICNVEAGIAVSPAPVGDTPGNKVECIKAKDARPFSPIYLLAQPVVYGPDPDEESSLVLIAREESPEEKRDKMSKDETTMYTVLLNSPGRSLVWKEWLAAGMDERLGAARVKNENAAKMAIYALRDSGRVKKDDKKGSPWYIEDAKTEVLDEEER